MAYYVTPDLGLELADPLTIQPFETTNVNSNFELLEAGIVADRVRLGLVEGRATVLETDVETLQDRVTARPADLAALAALPTGELLAGDLARVTAGGAIFVWSGSAWVQATQASFASVAARDTAYAKASAAYRVVGATARVGRLPYLHSGSGWLIDGGYAVVDAQDFSGTTITIDGLPTDLNSFRLELSSRGTAASLTAVLRTTVPADETGLKYDRTDILGRNSVTSSSTVPSTASWALSGFANTRHRHTLQIDGLTQAVETLVDHSALVVSDPQVAGTTNGKYDQALTHQDATAFGGLKLTFTASQVGRWVLYGAV